ncbi:MAG: DUF2508 family protein [Dehalobacterium sp.]|jgi:hypothetical protein
MEVVKLRLKILLNRLRDLYLKITVREVDPMRQHVLLVHQAHREWQWAQKTYNEVTDPDLVDQVIFWQSSTERGYIHLLKKAREEGIRADFETIAYLALIARNKI